jgi:hypothetical protein
MLSANAKYALCKAASSWHQFAEVDDEVKQQDIRELEAAGLVEPRNAVCHAITTDGYLFALWLSRGNPLLLRDSVKGVEPCRRT